MSGLLIAAPNSGSGKTTITLGLLRALRNRGIAVKPGKAGPDYIDPAFHQIACGVECVNFDPWAMRPELLLRQAANDKPLIIEAMMGLHDAAADHTGSPASLARLLDLTVVLVVDCARMSHSVGAVVAGYAAYDPEVRIAGLILNRVGSARHEAMLRAGLARTNVPILGVIMQDKQLALPERHLGLVQAGEIHGIDAFIEHAAETVATCCDMDVLVSLAQRSATGTPAQIERIPAPGARIAIARDEAFAFIYPHLMDGWREQGAEISHFSPLADEGPEEAADAVFLPGGYPELHAGRLAAAGNFKRAMQAHAERGSEIYGECGGYMTLGETLVDASGVEHPMLGLLPLATSFAARRRHLGYRRVRALSGCFAGRDFTAHEFHYSTVVREGQAERLFEAIDAAGEVVGPAGLSRGNVSGSYMHLIDLAGTRG
ncbi:cobyrinate a,c-diamide synthase [Rhizobium sp. KVB221]|uniref:Hydrogenobyrinate a,c-diamide synthase n=1 Tax=Rhizobium setariae TaxID=2801340 RepID=A0A937CQK8_9HYPH|nr:cobyrinate a,c-diamide synthase [Rhizobium setariae]MBL0373147.1 cobyrinate a,c-diamide synthase [Rhizobium setariae]